MTALSNTIINDLKIDVASIIEERENKRVEVECLQIGKEAYEQQKNWIKVASYQRAITAVQATIAAQDELITTRIKEIRRIEEESKFLFDDLLQQYA